jgi:hypothetical protein
MLHLLFKDCGLVPEVLNGNTTLAFEGYTQLGERAVVECDIGYHINGTFWKFDFIFCTPAGTWENRTCDFSGWYFFIDIYF